MQHIEVASEGKSDLNHEKYWLMILKKYCRHKLAVGGLIFFLFLILIAILAPWIAPYNPNHSFNTFQAPPSSTHWLGTDLVGRDVFSRIIYGSRISLAVGIGTVAITTIIGIILGGIAGYCGKKADMIIMRITEIFQVFPDLILIMVVISFIGPNLINIIVVVALLGWPPLARLVRGNLLFLKNQDFIHAAKVLKIHPIRIYISHLLPNLMAPILVNATFGISSTILLEASLSFLGLGVQPPLASWGNMLTDAQSLTILTSKPWLWIPPGLMIILTVLSINFIGDGLRDVFDPKTK